MLLHCFIQEELYVYVPHLPLYGFFDLAALAHGVAVDFWNLSGLGHTLNCCSFFKIWYHGGMMKGRYSSLTHCALVYYWLWPWYCHECRTPSTEEPKSIRQCLLEVSRRHQGRCLDGKLLVDLGPELESIGLVMSLGSWLRMCSETAVGRFKEQRGTVRMLFSCSSSKWRLVCLCQGLCHAGEQS